MAAPIVAAIVLIGGVALLIVNSGSSEPETVSPPRIAEINDPDEPTVETTVPAVSTVTTTETEPTVPTEVTVADSTVPPQTSPPLVEPSTSVSTTTTTVAANPDAPTQEQLDATLVSPDDFLEGEWELEEVSFDDVCGSTPEVDAVLLRSDVVYQELVVDVIGVREIDHEIYSFSDEATAERAYDGEVGLIEACDSTTVDLGEFQYRVEVLIDEFSPDQLESFPCVDQASIAVMQLTNENAPIEYIGRSITSLRCGVNVSAVGFISTIGLEDLENNDYFAAVTAASFGTAELPGS